MAKSELFKKILKSSQVEEAAGFDESKILNNQSNVPTDLPALNIALSGQLDKGLSSGVLTIAGPSKHFKSLLGLLVCKAYLDAYPEAVMIFYDSEFGAPRSYFESVGIDTSRVVHIPVSNMEQIKNSMVNILDNITRGEKAIVFFDSYGNTASKKEIDDAMAGSDKADMTRAKSGKSLFRMITSKLKILDIPMVIINHIYSEIGAFPKDILAGGTGILYASNDVWFIGRQKERDGTEISGYNFIIKIEKSRFVVEGKKIPITVSNGKGIFKYSALLPLALLGGFIVKPSNGWYQLKDTEQKVREKDTGPLLDTLLVNEDFKNFVKTYYQLAQSKLISEETPEDVEENISEE